MTAWKQPVPRAFWDWARWTLGGKRGPRPETVGRWLAAHGRRSIPPDWYVHRAWISRKPRPRTPAPVRAGLGIFGTGNGAVFTHPGGDSEMAVELLSSGFTYALVNVGEHPASVWDTFRGQADSRGLLYGPWARETTLDDVRRVEEIADQWAAAGGTGGRILGHNVENPEVMSTLQPATLPAGYTSRPKARLGIPEGWVPNGAGWAHAGFDAIAPETFMNVRRSLIPKVCVDHAVSESGAPGLPMFGIGLWDEARLHPELYEPMIAESEYLGLWPGPFLVYSMNGQEPHRWRRD